MIKNNTKVTSEIQKTGFIGSTPDKIGQNSNKKLILLT